MCFVRCFLISNLFFAYVHDWLSLEASHFARSFPPSFGWGAPPLRKYPGPHLVFGTLAFEDGVLESFISEPKASTTLISCCFFLLLALFVSTQKALLKGSAFPTSNLPSFPFGQALSLWPPSAWRRRFGRRGFSSEPRGWREEDSRYKQRLDLALELQQLMFESDSLFSFHLSFAL